MHCASIDNTRIITDIAIERPVLLINRGLRGSCSALWRAWVATYTGQCAHHEYMAATILSLPSPRTIDPLGIAISPVFTWGRVIIPRKMTDCITKYKYILHLPREGDIDTDTDTNTATALTTILFTYSAIITMRYHFEDVSYRYYTYIFTKIDHARQLTIRQTLSLSSLCFDMASVLALTGGYNVTITAKSSHHSYRINNKLNICMHDRCTYPISMVETKRLESFMKGSTLDFHRAIPVAIRGDTHFE